MRLHSFQHGVEIVGIHLDELPLLELGKRLLRVPGEVSKDSYHEGQFLDLNGAANLNVIGNLHPGRTHPVQLVLCALSSHNSFLELMVIQNGRAL